MREQCEASWLRVPVLPNGGGRCPCCGDEWHRCTEDGRLYAHKGIGTPSTMQQRALDLAFHHQVADASFRWPGWPEMRRQVVERDERESARVKGAAPPD